MENNISVQGSTVWIKSECPESEEENISLSHGAIKQESELILPPAGESGVINVEEELDLSPGSDSENQDNSLITKATKLLKAKLLTSLEEEIDPLVVEVLRHSRHFDLEDVIHGLSLSELLVVALLQVLSKRNTVAAKTTPPTHLDFPSISTSQPQTAKTAAPIPTEFAPACTSSLHTAETAASIPTEPATACSSPLQMGSTGIRRKADDPEPQDDSSKRTRRGKRQRRTYDAHSPQLESKALQVKAIISAKTAKRNKVAVMTQALFAAVMTNDYAAARVAIMDGANVEMRDGAGSTPLHLAAGWGPIKLVDLLLEAGADIEAVTKSGNRPLHWAARWGKDAAVARMVKAGADIHGGSEVGGRTPLQEATRYSNHSTVKLLRSLGAQR